MARVRKNPENRGKEEKKEPKKVFVLACEGQVTEVEYFKGIEKYREEFNISNTIKVEILEREEEKIRHSHPNHVIDQLKKYEDKFGLEEDELCLIVDRDKESFSKRQYNNILRECKELKYGFYLSNPTFEFWLLLHFKDLKIAKEKEEVFKNRKIKGERFLVHEMSKLLGEPYNKSIEFERYKNGVLSAVKRAKKFELDEKLLRDNLGTNLGLLIEKFREE